MPTEIDHLIVASPSLQEGVNYVESMLGVSATPGGSHPGFGTCNALIGLGRDCYLEIMAPDESQSDFQGERPFGIDTLQTTQLVAWVARRLGLREFAAVTNSQNIKLAEPMHISRQSPSGDLLEWQMTYLEELAPELMAVLPLLIDWGNTPNPASSCGGEALLQNLELEHPQPDEIGRILNSLELDVEVSQAALPGIKATIDCPLGLVEIHT